MYSYLASSLNSFIAVESKVRVANREFFDGVEEHAGLEIQKRVDYPDHGYMDS